MSNYTQEMFACQNADGDLIGVDQNCGGYPWVPTNMRGVMLWFRAQDIPAYLTYGREV